MRSVLLSIMFGLISSVSWGENVTWSDLVKDPSDNLTYQRFMAEPFTGVASASPEYPVLGLFEDGLKAGTIEFNEIGLKKNRTDYSYLRNNQLRILYTCKNFRRKCRDKEGLVAGYYENGQLFRKENYKDGEQHGLQEYFNEDGSLNSSFKYKNGKMIFD